jgi:ERCC4-type nuclease
MSERRDQRERDAEEMACQDCKELQAEITRLVASDVADARLNPILCPFTVVIDTREGHPWTFDGLEADADRKYRPLIVPTVTAGLKSGDYSIQGAEHLVAVERKSLADLYSTLGQQRERFERELVRLAAMEFAAVVVEAGWAAVLNDPPATSKLRPKTVYRSVLAWQQRFPRVHWWLADTRSFAERTAFRILQRFYLDRLAPNAPFALANQETEQHGCPTLRPNGRTQTAKSSTAST